MPLPAQCDKCMTLERQLRDIEIEIETDIAKRDSGAASEEDEARLTEKLSLFHQTKLIYDLHKQRSHR